MPKNLWGDLTSLEVVRTPKTVLEEQANLLTKATKGVLFGVVEDASYPGQFQYNLDVRVPSLNNYSYTILSVSHSLDLFPLRLRAERPATDVKIDSDDQFEDLLERILSSSEVRSALSRLKSQVQKL
jgi:hypothetical protein